MSHLFVVPAPRPLEVTAPEAMDCAGHELLGARPCHTGAAGMGTAIAIERSGAGNGYSVP